MDTFGNDVVLVPVKMDRLPAVLRARDGGDAAGSTYAKGERMEQHYGPQKDWSGDDLARLFAMSKPNMRLVLSHIANQPPYERVSLRKLSELVFEEGPDPNLNRISGTFNGLTRNSQNIRGRDSGVWPIFYDPHGETGFEYWMDAATAEKLREVTHSFHP